MAGISSQALNFGTPDNKKLYSGKELQSSEFSDNSGLELYDFSARSYDPQIGRMNQIDPSASSFYSYTPYNYCLNDPMNMIDPDGRFSTHTDSSGNVLAVFNDGDLGVYKHDGNATAQSVQNAHADNNTSAGGTKMGETEYWDEFAAHDRNGQIIGNKAGNFADPNNPAHINFGVQKDGQMAYLAGYVKAILGMQNGFDALRFLMNTSQNGGWLDIKVALGANQGYLFQGKYVSGESLGNNLFGVNLNNLRNSTILDNLIGQGSQSNFFSFAASVFGNYNVRQNHTDLSKYSYAYFGEIPYSGRQIAKGYFGNAGANNFFNNNGQASIYGSIKIK